MLNNTIKEKIGFIIKDNLDKSQNINLEETFEDIGIGSLVFIKIMIEIEIRFKVEIDDKYYAGGYKSIGEFIDSITEFLSGGDSYGD